MPSPRPHLSEREVYEYVRGNCFPQTDRRLIGVEVEFLTVPSRAPQQHADFAAVRSATLAAELNGGSRVTFEPGGQLELVSPPLPTVGGVCVATAADLGVIRTELAACGIELVGSGLDEIRPARRVLGTPRYAAMEAFFDLDGLSGRTMMCRTAAVQVNVDFGSAPARRWRAAQGLGPVLAAAFANSPLWCGAPSGWHSARLATWRAIDPTRTAPVADGDDAATEWAQYALSARVMLVRLSDAEFLPVLDHVSFAEWMRWGLGCGYPTLEDFEYHLTTLFPPVRPRGWLEMRMIDALPDPWWRVPPAIVAALFYDSVAAEAVLDAAAPAAGRWLEAARDGMTDPALAHAASECFAIARGVLGDVGADEATTQAVEEYLDRFTLRGRSPADDVIEAATRQPVDAWT